MSKDGPLNNDSTWRSVSNYFDKEKSQGYKSESKKRAAAHGTWHLGQCYATGNQRECERAKDQFAIITGKPRDNLEKYDKEKGYSGKK
jgi:hypothetical protein